MLGELLGVFGDLLEVDFASFEFAEDEFIKSGLDVGCDFLESREDGWIASTWNDWLDAVNVFWVDAVSVFGIVGGCVVTFGGIFVVERLWSLDREAVEVVESGVIVFFHEWGKNIIDVGEGFIIAEGFDSIVESVEVFIPIGSLIELLWRDS